MQRLDGFVSLDSPYDQDALVVTKPLTFSGKRLQLNIDTDATGYAQVGLLGEKETPIPGYELDNCVYVNGDFVAKDVEWLTTGSDVAPLAGKTVRLAIRMRGE